MADNGNRSRPSQSDLLSLLDLVENLVRLNEDIIKEKSETSQQQAESEAQSQMGSTCQAGASSTSSSPRPEEAQNLDHPVEVIPITIENRLERPLNANAADSAPNQYEPNRCLSKAEMKAKSKEIIQLVNKLKERIISKKPHINPESKIQP
ncbi:Hypothetical predicted protein [Cloeon dipterum]|uniref:Uncharacterized protein n=1 Tax=Cloeon dipterum TaxID=197152 RepID=A0A8S1E3S3_9INSE|nr:Hypothetical predicted protein [Cloeon dipterum]